MNDHELDRMVAAAAPVTDGQVASLGLRDAEIELMEEIMATTTTTDPATDPEPRRPARPGRPRPLRRLPARYRVLAAAAAVAAITAAVLSGHEGDDRMVEAGALAYPETGMVRLVPDEVPAGFHMVDAVEYGQPSSWDATAYFGHQTDDGPVVDLVASWVNANEDAIFGPGVDGDPVTVRGHDGRACSGDECLAHPGVQAGVEWTEQAGKAFSLVSPTLTVDQIVAIADGLVVTGHESPPDAPSPATVVGAGEVHLGPVPDDLPVELEELGWRDYEGDSGGGRIVVPDPIPPNFPSDDVMPPTYVQLDYRRPDATGALTEALTVAVQPGVDVDLAARVATDAAEPIADVRGHPAWSATVPPGAGWDVERLRTFWQEAPGVVVTVETFGADDIDLDTLRDVAESLQPLTEAAWDELVAQPPPFPQQP